MGFTLRWLCDWVVYHAGKV